MKHPIVLGFLKYTGLQEKTPSLTTGMLAMVTLLLVASFKQRLRTNVIVVHEAHVSMKRLASRWVHVAASGARTWCYSSLGIGVSTLSCMTQHKRLKSVVWCLLKNSKRVLSHTWNTWALKVVWRARTKLHAFPAARSQLPVGVKQTEFKFKTP